jgi:hypothetical protein
MAEPLKTQTIEEYKKAIEWLMDQKSNVPIGNQLPQHAAALYELFFNRAKRQVVMFCKNLNKEVFDSPEVVTSFLAALKRGIQIRLVLQSNHDGECFHKVKDCVGFQIRKASQDDGAQAFNFCVKDLESYRFENDKNTTAAFAKMYSPDESLRLQEFFESMWTRAVPYIPADSV